MKRIAPEIEELMWDIAEKGDSRAMDEFEARYPDFKLELAQRISMVRNLRGERPRQSHVPLFQPKVEFGRPAPRRWTFALAGATILVAVAAASYLITSQLNPTPKLPVVRNESSSPFEANPSPQPEPRPAPINPPVNQNPPVNPGTSLEEEPAFLKRQDLVIKKASLSAALQLIAANAGLKLEIAPGMPDVEVALDYRSMTPIEMLQDLGRKHGFTAFEQGPREVLVIPAVESGAEAGDRERLDNVKQSTDNGILNP